MTRTKTLFLAAAGAALAFSAPAMAQERGMRGGEDMTRADVSAQAEQRFARMDANGDGFLDKSDRDARQAEGGEGKRGKRGGEGGKRGGGDRGERGDRGARMMEHADTNGDGRISLAEFTANALERFDRADANGDGTVTADERKAARQAHRAERQDG